MSSSQHRTSRQHGESHSLGRHVNSEEDSRITKRDVSIQRKIIVSQIGTSQSSARHFRGRFSYYTVGRHSLQHVNSEEVSYHRLGYLVSAVLGRLWYHILRGEISTFRWGLPCNSFGRPVSWLRVLSLWTSGQLLWRKTLVWRFWTKGGCLTSPWYNRTGLLRVKHQVTQSHSVNWLQTDRPFLKTWAWYYSHFILGLSKHLNTSRGPRESWTQSTNCASHTFRDEMHFFCKFWFWVTSVLRFQQEDSARLSLRGVWGRLRAAGLQTQHW